MKKDSNPAFDHILRSWDSLNDFIREASEEGAQELLDYETNGKRRKQYMLRIHSRVNKLRAERERTQIESAP